MIFNKKEILTYLEKHLSKNRYMHTLSTAKLAEIMAEKYNVDIQKVNIASILHDCAKWMDKESLIINSIQYGITPDNFQLLNYNILHSYASANVAKNKFGIDDIEILDAISNHTVPVSDITDLGKIIYIADKADETRQYEQAKKIRSAINELTLDELFLLTLKDIIFWHIQNNKPVHKNSIYTYNSMISKLNDKKE